MTKFITQLAIVVCFLIFPANVWAQEPPQTDETPTAADEPEAPDQVNVQPTAQDNEIDERLTQILDATEWFIRPVVNVQDGVVFLDGQTQQEDYRVWAGNLARNTQDVVAVVNRIEIIPTSAWDFSPVVTDIQSLWRKTVQSIPLIIVAIAVLLFFWWLTRYTKNLSQHFLNKYFGSSLLTTIASRTIAIPVFLLGLYLILQLAGLTGLALTLLGGTGIAGIIIGFAFQDIAENFLASLLLSVRNPFNSKDLIEVAGYKGIVQNMNTRSTVLMTLDGNHVQIPNAIVFKSILINYSANPNRRSDFVVGIGYTDGISHVQELIIQVLHDHPIVLESPEPRVVVETLGAATVNLHIYFWFDANKYAPMKIKSSLIRLTKHRLEEAGISMPDEAREIIFPEGVPILESGQSRSPFTNGNRDDKQSSPANAATSAAPEAVTSAAEGHLSSEEDEIQEQANLSRNPEEGENLLDEHR